MPTVSSDISDQMTSPDYIIVGSGPAGCVLAARLTEDAGTRVLLLEAGGSDQKLSISMPAAIPFVYQDKSLNWGEFAGPEPHLTGPDIDEKRGRVLGGSSSINAMIFNRGNPRDFDGWSDMGLEGWGWKDVLPYFKRMERFSEGANEARGGEGPLAVTRAPAAHTLFDVFMRSGEQAGHQRPADHNGGDQEGMHIAQILVDRGRRCSASHAYLRPVLHRPNLQVKLNAHVHRVLFQGDRAIGVELVSGAKHFAQREVLIAASSVGAAKLLLLSGVGPADELRGIGVPVTLDQPNVGRNLENHPGVNLQYGARREDSLVSQLGPLGRGKLGLQWLLTKRGLGAANFFEAGAFIKTGDDADYANLQLEFLPLARRVVNGTLKVLPGFQLWMDLSRPASRGHVRLTSANPLAKPEIVFNHLRDEADCRDMVRAVKLARSLFRCRAWDGIRGAEMNPTSDIQTDSEILSWARASVGTSYHPSGTCRMAASPRDGVVDHNGRVHGLQGLRVVCAAIIPRITTGNLSAPTYMIAEKISDNIRGKPA